MMKGITLSAGAYDIVKEADNAVLVYEWDATIEGVDMVFRICGELGYYNVRESINGPVLMTGDSFESILMWLVETYGR